MNSVDTNVIIRLLTKDDLEQYEISFGLFAQGNIFITDTVLLETEWVLRFSYKFDRQSIAQALTSLLQAEAVSVLDESNIFQSVELYKSGMDFGDALHLCKSTHCSSFYTFDRRLEQKAVEADIRQVIRLDAD